jgi:glycosyl transferase-like sugar-binding protein
MSGDAAMIFLSDRKLYTNTDYCLEYLQHLETVGAGQGGDRVIFHAYWYGDFGAKQALSLKSLLATQDLDRCELWLWLDDESGDSDYAANPWLSALLPLITVKKYSPLSESQGTLIDATGLLAVVHRWRRTRLLQDAVDPVHRSDVFRTIALYKYGGVYFDLDVLFLRNFLELFGVLPAGEFCYQWSSQPYANTALLKLEKESSIATHLLSKSIKGLDFHPKQVLNFDDKELNLLMLPCAFFDALWLHFDKKDISRRAPFDAFEDFFRPRSADRLVEPAEFYRGCFAFHWHNQWRSEEYANSYAGVFDRHFDEILRDKYGLEPCQAFQTRG